MNRVLIGVWMWAVLLTAASLCAQTPPLFTLPLYVASAEEIRDEYSFKLIGNGESVDGDLVQILYANNGIYPPDTNGNPHPDNPVTVTTRIGNQISPALDRPARFVAAIPAESRPAKSQKLFVRVFNAATLETASFYADSQVFTANVDEVTVIVGATTYPLDGSDADVDGLNNSWEKSYGTNPNATDTDADGQTDWEEAMAGSCPTNAGSVFAVASVGHDEFQNIRVTWSSASGHMYQVESAQGNLISGPTFSNVSEVLTAIGEQTQLIISNTPPGPGAFFRVRAVW